MSRLDAVKAWAAKNRVVLGAGGAVLVVGVAVARSRSKAGSSSSGGPTTISTAPSSGSQLAGVTGGAYSSTDSDLYNAFQPQVESLRDLMLKIQDGQISSVIPVPALPGGGTTETGVTTEAPAPVLDRIDTNWSSAGSIYQGQLSDGRSVSINQNDVWSGAFGGTGAAGGYNAAEADQIRTQLQNKGLLSTSADAARELAERAKGW